MREEDVEEHRHELARREPALTGAMEAEQQDRSPRRREQAVHDPKRKALELRGLGLGVPSLLVEVVQIARCISSRDQPVDVACQHAFVAAKAAREPGGADAADRLDGGPRQEEQHPRADLARQR